MHGENNFLEYGGIDNGGQEIAPRGGGRGRGGCEGVEEPETNPRGRETWGGGGSIQDLCWPDSGNEGGKQQQQKL